jgi:hypothetical protein
VQYQLEKSDISSARTMEHRVEGYRPVRMLLHSGVEQQLDQGGLKAVQKNSSAKYALEYLIENCAGVYEMETTSWARLSLFLLKLEESRWMFRIEVGDFNESRASRRKARRVPALASSSAFCL